MKFYSKKVIIKDAGSEFKERGDYIELKETMDIILGMCSTHL